MEGQAIVCGVGRRTFLFGESEVAWFRRRVDPRIRDQGAVDRTQGSSSRKVIRYEYARQSTAVTSLGGELQVEVNSG